MSLCVSKDGYEQAEEIRFQAVTFANNLKQILALAAFAVHAAAAIENFKKLSDIASRGLAIEEAQHAHLRDVYWPAENQFLDEFKQATPWDSQAVLTDRYAGRMWAPIAASFARKFHELQCNKPRYCTTAFRRALQELLVARAAAKSNTVTLASGIAFAEVEANSDRDFERRKQAVALRKGLVNQAAALMASAANGLASAGADSMRAASNALEAFGYARNRVPPVDPGFHANVMASLDEGGVVSARSGNTIGDVGSIGTSSDSYAGITAADGSEGWDSWGVNATPTMTESQGPFHANDANSSQHVLPGGQDQSLARGGIITVIQSSSGVATIDLGKADLVDISRYKADYEQISPDPLGNGNSTAPYVNYGSAQEQE